ncbi:MULTISPECIES: hypothetical protein [Klebsiella]|uniref:Fimbrial protein n=2 Tax=Klebsiella pneumoniae TaxID=573 RepID=A6T560_KLEP7|nr:MULTISPECIES: hypothetical protein [Klebsiella]ABR75731.1 hypothetical protein KPN_00278 [Klebsiella pneumoniae subsp. pneumoniae MGH 78578]EIX9414171.1 hypothetical protein [Klebsiella pneumoniae]EJK7776167.1 hypothetical protein [Klebsiella pneumoniae]EKA8127415.1 hypothetical protein [Klebsiella pneumoniae]EKQ1181582.1 hypothetical protein [Klebsiella pneumoniae]
MKWFVFMFAAIAATLMVTPEANSGSFDPVTGAYTTDPITVTLTPKTVAVSTSVIANGERVYWATDKYPQGAGTFYWGSHTYTLESASDVTLAIPGINASGVCTATGSGTSLTINGCFSFSHNGTIYMGKSASCKSFFSLQSNLSSLTNFGDFVALTLGPGTNTIQLNKTGITDVNTTSFTYPSTTRSTSYRWTTYDINLQATLSAKTPPYTYLYCSVSQGLRVIMTTGGVVPNPFAMVPAASKPAYSPTISYSPALPIINTIAVNIRNITAIDILPRTVFNTGTISAWRTTYMEQPLTVTGQGNITRDFGASQNFNVLESWTCATTGQIDFRIMRDNTNANVCSGATYTHPVQTPQSLTAQWKAQSSTASGAWSARATVTFTLP